MPLSAPFLPTKDEGPRTDFPSSFVPRLPSGPAAADRPRLDQRQRPPLELVAVVLGQLARRGEVLRLAHDRVILLLDQPEHVLQPVLHQGDGEVGDVDADPAPAQLLRGRDGGAAAAERVEHDVAGVAAGREDALQEREWLLRGVAEALGGL